MRENATMLFDAVSTVLPFVFFAPSTDMTLEPRRNLDTPLNGGEESRTPVRRTRTSHPLEQYI